MARRVSEKHQQVANEVLVALPALLLCFLSLYLSAGVHA